MAIFLSLPHNCWHYTLVPLRQEGNFHLRQGGHVYFPKYPAHVFFMMPVPGRTLRKTCQQSRFLQGIAEAQPSLSSVPTRERTLTPTNLGCCLQTLLRPANPYKRKWETRTQKMNVPSRAPVRRPISRRHYLSSRPPGIAQPEVMSFLPLVNMADLVLSSLSRLQARGGLSTIRLSTIGRKATWGPVEDTALWRRVHVVSLWRPGTLVSWLLSMVIFDG